MVQQLKLFKEFLRANSADPAPCNVIVELYTIAIEYYKKAIQRLEIDGVQMDETSSEEKLKNLLESILTDDKIHDISEGYLSELTKQETVERIIDVIKNPSSYADLFFSGPRS